MVVCASALAGEGVERRRHRHPALGRHGQGPEQRVLLGRSPAGENINHGADEGQGQAEAHTQQGAKNGDEARLQQEGSADHTALEANGAQHANLLAPLHNGAGGADDCSGTK